ncbi:MAG: hypothetical protein Q9210_003532 [Variospora velana]
MMHFPCSSISLGLALGVLASASPIIKHDKRSSVERNGTLFTVFEHAATDVKIEYVKNSGICETTPGVNQYSGYLSNGPDLHMWFWFFEARSDATTAPLAAWLSGGPGCSSMAALFLESGPCHFVNGETTPSLNNYSWNSYANMLYIDQPLGVGFSYGTDSVNSTVTAAPNVWKLLQAFYAHFPEYLNRDFGLFTESYGGHYGPEFADYFEQQNSAIALGTVIGHDINLVALGVNNGWFDSRLQEKAYIDFSSDNPYKVFIDGSEHTSYLKAYTTKCLPALQACASSDSDSVCRHADRVCYRNIQNPLIWETNFNPYDIRELSGYSYPDMHAEYLQTGAVLKAIGANSTYQVCADAPFAAFETTGDRARSFLPQLSNVVQKGIQTAVWAGDADWICNWIGNQVAAEAVDYSGQSEFKNASLAPYNVAGKQVGTFKTVGKLSFARIFEAGHLVPYYQPEAALQVFKQTMMGQALSST